VTLTSYVQSLALLAFADVVGDLALHSGVVQVASGIMNNHLRRVIPDHLLLVDEPPERRQENPADRARRRSVELKISSPP